ncbi:MAG: shikimate dehydrogenase [Candidatus Caenarcaniphilales bacterium]|nr:shikimate dehydrogenase [Candidatus Caenarcaniphilales bacterium]
MKQLWRLAVLGDPIAHSLSPQIHKVFLESAGLEGQYQAIRCPVEDFKQTISRLLDERYQGVNLTIPLKEIDLSCKSSADVELIGAKNTLILNSDKETVAENTDWRGFCASLPEDLEIRKVAILGLGGSARAVAYGLRKSFQIEQITFFIRESSSSRQRKSNFLSSNLYKFLLSENSTLSPAPVIEFKTHEHPFDPEVDLIINTTPLGMSGENLDRNPLQIRHYDGLQKAYFYDLIYSPFETTFLRQAKAHGYRAQNGWEMLLWQAAFAFELWTGISAQQLAQSFAKIPHQDA